MRLVVISDTHGIHRDLDLPEGDVLIHCGDITNTGEFEILADFNAWLKTLDFNHKLVIAGNHDLTLEKLDGHQFITNGTYLLDEQIVIKGIKFYGSPYVPKIGTWAFGLQDIFHKNRTWNRIPNNTDVLITHGPPKGTLDRTTTEEAGCGVLGNKVIEIQPKFHFFGHIHESHGIYRGFRTTYHNASVLDWPSNQRHNLPIRTFDI